MNRGGPSGRAGHGPRDGQAGRSGQGQDNRGRGGPQGNQPVSGGGTGGRAGGAAGGDTGGWRVSGQDRRNNPSTHNQNRPPQNMDQQRRTDGREGGRPSGGGGAYGARGTGNYQAGQRDGNRVQHGNQSGQSKDPGVFLPQSRSQVSQEIDMQENFYAQERSGPQNELFDLFNALDINEERQKTKEKDPSSEHLQVSLSARPAFGSQGKPVTLWANYVRLHLNEVQIIHRYSISVTTKQKPKTNQKASESDQQNEPDSGPTGKKLQRVIDLLLEEPQYRPHRDKIVTDFSTTLLSTVKLTPNSKVNTFSIIYRDDLDDEPPAVGRQVTYLVTVSEMNPLNFRDLLQHLRSNDLHHPYKFKQEMLQTLNIFLRHFAKNNSELVAPGKSITFPLIRGDPGPCKVEGEKSIQVKWLRYFRGYFSSIRFTTGAALANVNVTCSAFYPAIPLIDFMKTYFSTWSERPSNDGLEAALKRVRVSVAHLPKHKRAGVERDRVKTIFGLATKEDGVKGHGNERNYHAPIIEENAATSEQVKFWPNRETQGSQDSEFPPSSSSKGKAPATGPNTAPLEDRYYTVAEYFKARYTMGVDTKYPVVNIGGINNPVYLPADRCVILAGQRYNRKLSGSGTKDMQDTAANSPGANAWSIYRMGLGTVGLDESKNSWMKEFGIGADRELMKVPGRILSPPKLAYNGTQELKPDTAQWNLTQVRFQKQGILGRWIYLQFIPEGGNDPLRGTLRECINSLRGNLTKSGISNQIAPDARLSGIVSYHNVNDPRISNALNSAPPNGEGKRFVLVVLPDKSTELYNQVKELCDKKWGIANVCVTQKVLAKKNGTCWGNLALKINLKIGGDNHSVDESKLAFINQGKTMVVGIDVTHPGANSLENAPSIAAMVASTNSTLCQFPAVLKVNPAREEMVASLADMLVSRLNHWHEKNKIFPENILVYRDGVSEGQYDLVLRNELPKLREGCRRIYKGDLPKISIIIVAKRHHTRFYPTNKDDTDGRTGNCKNGAVVDRQIVPMKNWEFFLQAHAPILGTARPSHYFVILDEIFKSHYKDGQRAVDALEEVTHSMCYAFARATKAVSVCPPAYYADIACERGRRYLHRHLDPPPKPVGGVRRTIRNCADTDLLVAQVLKDSMFYL